MSLTRGVLCVLVAFASVCTAASHAATAGRQVVVRREARREVSRGEALEANRPGSASLLARCPWCLSSEDVSRQARALVENCGGALSVEIVDSTGAPAEGEAGILEVATVRLPGRKTPAANRAFYVFGEHSRELITVESGVQLLKSLCSGAQKAAVDNFGVSDDSESLAQKALRDTEFRMVLNANPKSRREVEEGKFCKRTDENDVDLNRNWDFHWDNHILDVYGEKLNPGSKPFSEPESHALMNLVKAFKPTSFLSIHSGNLGMYSPWAYDPKAGEASAEMTELLESTQRKYCQECAYGSASKHIGYSSPGTSVDWAFARGGARYSYAFEIYVGSGHNSTSGSMLEASQLVGGAAGAGGLAESSALSHGRQLRQALAAGEKANKFEAAACFFRYNPSTEAERAAWLQRWTEIYLSMAGEIAAKLRDERI